MAKATYGTEHWFICHLQGIYFENIRILTKSQSSVYICTPLHQYEYEHEKLSFIHFLVSLTKYAKSCRSYYTFMMSLCPVYIHGQRHITQNFSISVVNTDNTYISDMLIKQSILQSTHKYIISPASA